MLLLPVTLSTASVLAFVYLALVARVGRRRRAVNVSIGDGGDADLLMRMRTQANFVEYVPLLLVLMGLLEASGANPTALAVAGGLLILFRISHAVGMPRPARNVYRAVGAGGTILMLPAAAVWGLAIVLMR